MKKLFDELSYKVSKQTTKQYSTSFSLGILALSPKIRNAIYAIYGYVRLADEIVDSFHGYDKQKLLSRFRDETNYALEEKISLNPILHSFQETIHQYQIDFQLIDQFLRSMEMDLHKIDYTKFENVRVEINAMNPNLPDAVRLEKKALRQSMIKNFILGNMSQYKILLQKYKKVSSDEKRLIGFRNQVIQKGPAFLNLS